MQNKIENKAKFFGLYWGQAILRMPEETILFISNQNNLSYEEFLEDGWLELTHLSQIRDEDAIEVIRFFTPDINPDYVKQADKEEFEQFFLILSGDLLEECASNNYSPLVYQKTYDYLRSKGYALPYMGLSVEKLIEFGWVKLKE